jgi:hypothetical protein
MKKVYVTNIEKEKFEEAFKEIGLTFFRDEFGWYFKTGEIICSE